MSDEEKLHSWRKIIVHTYRVLLTIVDSEDTEAEWKLFQQLIFTYYKGNSIYQVLSKLICHGDIAAAFPNLTKLAMIWAVLPVTTTTVEHSFSSMKLIKTRL